MTAEKRLSLRTKRAIVDRFMAGESTASISLFKSDGSWQPGWFSTSTVESILRWSANSKCERARVWRYLTKAGPKPKKPRKGRRK